jgi:hypothetical protein
MTLRDRLGPGGTSAVNSDATFRTFHDNHRTTVGHTLGFIVLPSQDLSSIASHNRYAGSLTGALPAPCRISTRGTGRISYIVSCVSG